MLKEEDYNNDSDSDRVISIHSIVSENCITNNL